MDQRLPRLGLHESGTSGLCRRLLPDDGRSPSWCAHKSQIKSAGSFVYDSSGLITRVVPPGSIALSKVRFGATQEWEFVHNFKLLQKAFDSAGIKRVKPLLAPHHARTYVLMLSRVCSSHAQHIDVPKLIRAKYLDNLEFLQWFKRYFDNRWDKAEYRAKERRSAAIKAAAASNPATRRSIQPGFLSGQGVQSGSLGNMSTFLLISPLPFTLCQKTRPLSRRGPTSLLGGLSCPIWFFQPLRQSHRPSVWRNVESQ